jgi:endoglycosylceramidase
MQAREELLRQRRSHCHRVATLLALTLFTLGAPSLLPCAAGAAEREAWGEGPIPPLSHQGRWLTDARGRVVLLHGFSDVAKTAPFYPAAFGFGEADAAFLEHEGFTALRLGVEFQGLMPTPGQVDERYIEALAGTVELLGRHRIFVLLDFHQDGFSPYFLGGNGFPDWMVITDGLPNPPVGFPLYYVSNPAMQRAFERFWANSPGPDGIPLQDYFVQGLVRVVERFAENPWVLGYELMNEPFPGAEFAPCLSPEGCVPLEQQRLLPFYRKATAAVRRVSPNQFVFIEPFVLFNFGLSPTSLPGAASGDALSIHSYALDLAGEQGVLSYGSEAAVRDGAALLVTEFGATSDPATLQRLSAEMELHLLPWLEWAYTDLKADPSQPAGPHNLQSPEAFAALVRPYPLAVAGTPSSLSFDPASGTFDFSYTTVSPGGEAYPRGLLTALSIPALQYPEGYRVTVSGARIVSRPCMPLLLLRNLPHAEQVSIEVVPSPAPRCSPPDREAAAGRREP